MDTDSVTQQIALFGYPLGHSISPAMQQAALDHYSLPIKYLAWPAQPKEFAFSIEQLRYGHYLGANVTIPYKETVIQSLDSIDSWATKVRAVNTVVNRDGVLIGYNTDSYGFIKSLTEGSGIKLDGISVLMLGAGGAARAAAYGLAESQVSLLTIANRTVERAQTLALDLRNEGVKCHHVSTDIDELAPIAKKSDLIINATPVGMRQDGSENDSPLSNDLIPPTSLVYDMVYTPTTTPLIKEALKVGAETMGGLDMLVYQGAASFKLWTGLEAPIELMFEAAKRALDG